VIIYNIINLKKGKYIILAIDDIRDCKGADLIARNYELGCFCIDLMDRMYNSRWELWIDHDLGENKTGYDIINYIESNYHNFVGSKPPEIVKILSANPVGRDRIIRALNSMNYIQLTRNGELIWKFDKIKKQMKF
jgi:hypothetical protein